MSEPGTRRPETVEQALARAGQHGRRAASEALLAARALLDALALALHGARPEERRILGLAARALDDLSETLAGGTGRTHVLAAIADALDAEIARWEKRARDDGDARAVLRAYLGLREILWEFGVRSERAGSTSRKTEPTTPAEGGRQRARREPGGRARRPAEPGREGPGRRPKRVPIEG